MTTFTRPHPQCFITRHHDGKEKGHTVLSQLFRGNDLFTSMFTAQMGVVNYSRSLENHKPFRSCSRPSSKGRAQRLATARRASPPGPKARPAGALPARGQASGSARKSVLLPQGSPAGEKLQFCAAIQSAAASSAMLAHRPPSRSSPSRALQAPQILRQILVQE